jgi:cytochrome c-type biogenesis protein CcmE
MFKKKRFLIGGLLVLLAVGYLGYTAFANAATYYYMVGEVVAKGESIYGEKIRMEGKAVPGSIVQESAGRVWKFTMVDKDGPQTLAVIYEGVAPDTFKDDADVVVEGSLGADGIFRAKTLMAKCPSRYEPEV